MAYQNNETEKVTRIQTRGVWHRPNVTNEETTLESICSVLDKFQHAGINLIFLETFYHGMTVFKTSTVEYYTGFENHDYGDYPDYLSAFVAEAKKRNIEVHAWVEDFYIGVNSSRFVKNCPQWLLLNSKGEYRQSEGAEYGGYIFLDPANAEVRKFLVDFYSELLTKFPDIKGLNLDYIRYPVSSPSDDTGFTKQAMKQFSALQGWDEPADISSFIKKLNSSGAYSKFTDFRASCVTGFVSEVCDMVREKHPSVLLSTAIFPETSMSYNQKKQDFTKWLKEGYIDIVTPMAYYDDNGTLRSALTEMMKDCKSSYCYAGLSSTYHSLSNSLVLEQIKVCDDVGADGFVFFGSQSILKNEGYIQLLHENYGSTSKNDITPHASISDLINAVGTPLINELLQKAASGEENEKKIQELEAQLSEIASLGEDSQWALNEAENRLKLLVKYNLQAYVSSANLEIARTELEPLYRYASVHARRAEIKGILPQTPPEDNTEPPSEHPTDTPPAKDEDAAEDVTSSEPPANEDEPSAPDTPKVKPDVKKRVMIAMAATVAGIVSAVTAAIVIIKRKRKKKFASEEI